MQELEAVLCWFGKCSLLSEEHLSQALSLAAALAASSEDASMAVVLLQQQQEQGAPQKTPYPSLCGILSGALCQLDQQPCAAQLLLHVLRCCSNDGTSTAWVQRVAAELFKHLPETASHSPDASILQATAQAWRLLDARVCSNLIPDDPSGTR